MSFVERNKTWLLPVLGVGVVGVLWFNLRTPAPPPVTPQTPAEASPLPASNPAGTAAPDASQAPSAAPVAAPATAPTLAPLGPDSWADLRSLNGAPNLQGQSTDLTTQATRPLSAEQLSPVSALLLNLPSLANPSLLGSLTKTEGGPATAPPPLDFISRTPAGYQAWYGGVGFKSGQTILGTAYRIQDIKPPKVILDGPSGRVEQATYVVGAPKVPTHSETP